MTQTDRSNRGRPLFHSETSAIQVFGGIFFLIWEQELSQEKEASLAIAIACFIKHNLSS